MTNFFLYCHVAVLQRGFYREQMWWTEWPFLLLFMHLELFGESASAMLYHISNAQGFLCRSTELSCAVSKFSSFRHPKSHPISRIGSSWRIVASRFCSFCPVGLVLFDGKHKNILFVFVWLMLSI
jgi:hypothetical protein